MSKIGYMRISTKEQDNSLQRVALEKYGCEKIFDDKISGKKKVRAGLDACMAALQPGDTLVVWKLDRLGRRVSHLSVLIEELQERKIAFAAIMDNFDSSTVAGRAMLGMMCVFAQMERETISERVKAGLGVRRSKGLKLGPPYKVDGCIVDRVREMHRSDFRQWTIARETGISQASVCRILRESNTARTSA